MTRTAVTDADFYLIEQTLDDDGRQLLRRVREFMEKTVPRRLRARAGLRPAAAAVRPADRRLPAGAGPAGEDAVERHRFGLPVRSAVRSAAGRPGRGPPLRAGQGVLHGPDAGSDRLGARTARREWHPAGEPRGPVRRRLRGDLLLRRHPRDQHADRGPRHRRPGRVRVRSTGTETPGAGLGGVTQRADQPPSSTYEEPLANEAGAEHR